jgi:hypothetical protein
VGKCPPTGNAEPLGSVEADGVTRRNAMSEQTKTEIVDLFLEKHGAVLPGHVIDFALDVRSVIAELEEQLTPVSV